MTTPESSGPRASCTTQARGRGRGAACAPRCGQAPARRVRGLMECSGARRRARDAGGRIALTACTGPRRGCGVCPVARNPVARSTDRAHAPRDDSRRFARRVAPARPARYRIALHGGRATLRIRAERNRAPGGGRGHGARARAAARGVFEPRRVLPGRHRGPAPGRPGRHRDHLQGKPGRRGGHPFLRGGRPHRRGHRRARCGPLCVGAPSGAARDSYRRESPIAWSKGRRTPVR